jgi:hypothetical protein
MLNEAAAATICKGCWEEVSLEGYETPQVAYAC